MTFNFYCPRADASIVPSTYHPSVMRFSTGFLYQSTYAWSRGDKDSSKTDLLIPSSNPSKTPRTPHTLPSGQAHTPILHLGVATSPQVRYPSYALGFQDFYPSQKVDDRPKEGERPNEVPRIQICSTFYQSYLHISTMNHAGLNEPHFELSLLTHSKIKVRKFKLKSAAIGVQRVKFNLYSKRGNFILYDLPNNVVSRAGTRITNRKSKQSGNYALMAQAHIIELFIIFLSARDFPG